MRADAAQYTLTALPTLAETLALLAGGQHTPIAGGTELMVAFSAGRLPTRPLLSLHHLRELRFIDITPTHIILGSGTTFTDLRTHPTVAAELPLLAQAASWTGSVANQNRGTLGGNLVNASPAADSPPALLCYEAQLRLISAAGSRTLHYDRFHLGYKQTALRTDELLESITLPRTFAHHQSSIRKVGARNAQAISKIALASLLLVEAGTIRDIRLAAASLAPIPLRLRATEAALLGRSVNAQTIQSARQALASEIAPIDDIRSTAGYRKAVAGNLLEALLTHLV